jgi:hypothetical protein
MHPCHSSSSSCTVAPIDLAGVRDPRRRDAWPPRRISAAHAAPRRSAGLRASRRSTQRAQPCTKTLIRVRRRRIPPPFVAGRRRCCAATTSMRSRVIRAVGS